MWVNLVAAGLVSVPLVVVLAKVLGFGLRGLFYGIFAFPII